MKPAILVAREVFDAVLASLGAHFEVVGAVDDAARSGARPRNRPNPDAGRG
ncbi:hypothetical protein [Thiobacter aerophilum]|uniref:Uncharacterized protein n=1 Tax=Thiobacter aerophilum TaxID=3121275 RepID=A0ABV0EIZ7_9BURK